MKSHQAKKSLLLLMLILSFTNQLIGLEVKGKILNFDQSEITINLLFGGFAMKSDDLKIPVTKEGVFSIEIKVKEIRYSEMKIGEKRVQLFLSPKNSNVIISLDYSDFKNTLTFEGGSSIENTFLNKRVFLNYDQKFNELNKEGRQDAEKIDQYFENEEFKELNQLRKVKGNLPKEHYQILSEEIRNYYLMLKIKGGLEVANRDLESYEQNWMKRNDGLVRQINCQPSNIYNPYFNHLLWTYYSHLERKLQITLMKDSMKWKTHFEVESVSDIIKGFDRDSNNRPFYILTAEEMCEGILEKALSNIIYRSQEGGDYENLEYVYEEFKKRFPQSEFLERLEPRMEMYKKSEKTEEGQRSEISFYPIKNSIKSMGELLNREEFKNKVVLVDIWGTWCGPCREEFKYLKALKSKLKDEDVVFLYLADEKRSNPENHWKEAANIFDLVGYHYLLKPEVSDDLWDKVDPNSGLRLYPTYMIIKRNKEVAIPRAHLPSEGDKLYDQIKKVLEEK